MFFERRMGAEVIGFAMLQHEQAIGFQQVVPEYEVGKVFQILQGIRRICKDKVELFVAPV